MPKLTSFDTGVTHFIGQNVIRETIPVTLGSVKFLSLASLAIKLSLSLWLASLLSSLFIYVKVYHWYPLPKWLNFATFLKGFVEIPERTKTPEHTCIYRNALLILFFPLLVCGFMTLLLFVCHLYAVKLKWILI